MVIVDLSLKCSQRPRPLRRARPQGACVVKGPLSVFGKVCLPDGHRRGHRQTAMIPAQGWPIEQPQFNTGMCKTTGCRAGWPSVHFRRRQGSPAFAPPQTNRVDSLETSRVPGRRAQHINGGCSMLRETLTDRDHERVLEFSWELAGARSVAELGAAALERMQQVISADRANFGHTDLHKKKLRAIEYSAGGWRSPPDAPSSLDHIADPHNLVLAEILRGRNTPFSVSSIIPVKEFLRTELYELAYKPFGTPYQVIVPIQTNRQALTGSGYALSRSSEDFSSRDMRRLYALQAVLTAHHAVLQVQPRSEPQIDAAPGAARLTQRERQVLSLVASGMTAVAIGHSLRISPRTARKHIENSYSKLDIHDRLQAVSYCRQAGLLS